MKQVYSIPRVYISNLVTVAVIGLLWILTHNVFAVIAATFIFGLFIALCAHKEVTTLAKVIFFAIIALVFIIGIIFAQNAKNLDDNTGDTTGEDIIDVVQEEETQQDETEGEPNNGSSSGGNTNYYPPRNSSKVTDPLIPSFSNVGTGSTGVNLGNMQSTGSSINNIQSNFGEGTDQDEEIAQEVEEGKDVIDSDSGITGVVDNTPVEEEKPDAPQVDIDTDNALDAELGTEDTTLPDDNQSDDESQNQDDVSNEEVETPEQPDENNQGEQTQPENDNNSSEETIPAEPTTSPVTITPIDGNEAVAGSTVQFEISGDVQSVEGLDGLDYSISGEYLNVSTVEGEATVISPVVIGTDGSSATTSVTVNVIN